MRTPDALYFKDPFIGYYRNLASPEECQNLMELARDQLTVARVLGHDKPEVSQARIAEQAVIDHTSPGLVHSIASRIAEIVDLPLSHAQRFQIAKYSKGGKFDAHIDTFNEQTPFGQEAVKKYGQRLYSTLLYLNSVSAGGETYFPHLGLQIKPLEGDLLVFENCKTGTAVPHPLSLHGSHPVVDGEKWIVTIMFCERAFY